jgi:hypothetical protein
MKLSKPLPFFDKINMCLSHIMILAYSSKYVFKLGQGVSCVL